MVDAPHVPYLPLGALPSREQCSRRLAPSEELQDRVAAYFEIKLALGESTTVRTLPEGCTDLIFDLVAKRAWFSGPRTTAECYRHDGPARLVGAQLYPGVGHLLTGRPSSTLLNQAAPLDSLLDVSMDEVIFQLCSCSDPSTRLNSLLSEHLRQLQVDRRIRSAVVALIETGGKIPIHRLESRARTTSRTLTRLFQTWVGMSPKAFARVVRFQGVLRVIERHSAVGWATIARDMGYADQAHLIRDFAAYSGLTPSQLIQED